MDVQWQNSQMFNPHHYDHHNPLFQQQTQPPQQNGFFQCDNNIPPSSSMRKRKADAQPVNERLSKRLSLLNLEKNGHKLYVPVNNTDNHHNHEMNNSLEPVPEVVSPSSSQSPPGVSRPRWGSLADDDAMHLDDTRHKVYIYDLDAELSSSEAEADDEPGSPTSGKGRLVFLPDIEKHLFSHDPNSNLNRRITIPPSIYANQEGELAGHNVNDMQMVLYRESEPSSLTVPRHQDNVRRAILEARARLREKQQQERDLASPVIEVVGPGQVPPLNAADPTTMMNVDGLMTTDPYPSSSSSPAMPWSDDGDAMDMD
ncbi:hypothetical protein F5Y17DRAFT_104869 [Xylariaceae sp. FL0594]|nr:hypothetical protein F5Y17DRAFT_104869 [Xylariaceae sp. FL0594]